MTQLTNNLRKYKVKFKDGRDDINITEKQYNELRLIKEDQKISFPVTIRDVDNWKILFDWEIWAIKEFQEREFSWAKYNVICDYWNRHPIQNWKYNCDCKNNYWYYGFELKIFVSQKYWIIYPQDITPEHRKEFYLIKNNKNTPQN